MPLLSYLVFDSAAHGRTLRAQSIRLETHAPGALCDFTPSRAVHRTGRQESIYLLNTLAMLRAELTDSPQNKIL
jgi:hypothetical protein